MNSKLKKLLRQIKKIDMKAYYYIKITVIPRCDSFGKNPPDDLPGMFIWSESPQGNEYWANIYLKTKD